MNKQIRQWKDEIEKIKENEAAMRKKNAARIKELQGKIDAAIARKEVDDNKAVGDLVRATFGEITEDTIRQMKELLEKNGHTLSGRSAGEL